LRVTYCDQLAQELEMKGKEKQLSNALNVFKNLEQHIFLLKDELQHFLDMLNSDKELI